MANPWLALAFSWIGAKNMSFQYPSSVASYATSVRFVHWVSCTTITTPSMGAFNIAGGLRMEWLSALETSATITISSHETELDSLRMNIDRIRTNTQTRYLSAPDPFPPNAMAIVSSCITFRMTIQFPACPCPADRPSLKLSTHPPLVVGIGARFSARSMASHGLQVAKQEVSLVRRNRRLVATGRAALGAGRGKRRHARPLCAWLDLGLDLV